MVLQYGFYFLTHQLQARLPAPALPAQREVAHAPCVFASEGGTGLRPVTSRWDESEEGGTPAVHGGRGGARVPRARWQAGPSCPMTQVPLGRWPPLLRGRAEQRVWVGQASAGAGGMPGAGPSCPSRPDTSWVILLSNRSPMGSLRSTARANVLPPLPSVGRVA